MILVLGVFMGQGDSFNTTIQPDMHCIRIHSSADPFKPVLINLFL